ncbi:hypothetical protein GGS20DRAFT_536830 [Poronia punctata]|nr:hypothetical protein GGS20DRAFT_536830 [Poronia punctata]
MCFLSLWLLTYILYAGRNQQHTYLPTNLRRGIGLGCLVACPWFPLTPHRLAFLCLPYLFTCLMSKTLVFLGWLLPIY